MSSIVKKLWTSSPASLTRAVQRRLKLRDSRPGWFTIRGGPATGARLNLPHAQEGGWLHMVEGTFDEFLYSSLAGPSQLQGKVCWDVGAHIGYHSLCFAALGARVLAFEPNSANAQRLLDHIKENPTLGARIRHLPIALSDREGHIRFVQCTDLTTGSSGSHLAEALPPSAREAYQDFEQADVPSMQMDTLLERGEPAPDVIKIDVEGGEYLVLKGGAKLLKHLKPLLFIEVHHICLMMEIQKFLQDLDYSTRVLDQEHATASRCFIMAAGKR